MKLIITIGILACSMVVFGQSKIEKNVPVQNGQKVEMFFDYPNLIKVHTWDKKEVAITGLVSINRGENDDAFQVNVNNQGNVIKITSEIKDIKNLPHRTVIKKGEQEFYFKTGDINDPAVQRFIEENGGYTYVSNGVIQDITLEIYVPRGTECRIEAKYGLVEITDFNAPLIVDATYGGVDATITPAATGELVARTQFGEILTNLDAKFKSASDMTSHDHWTEIETKFGQGPNYDIESKFGKVYLRKPK